MADIFHQLLGQPLVGIVTAKHLVRKCSSKPTAKKCVYRDSSQGIKWNQWWNWLTFPPLYKELSNWRLNGSKSPPSKACWSSPLNIPLWLSLIFFAYFIYKHFFQASEMGWHTALEFVSWSFLRGQQIIWTPLKVESGFEEFCVVSFSHLFCRAAGVTYWAFKDWLFRVPSSAEKLL